MYPHDPDAMILAPPALSLLTAVVVVVAPGELGTDGATRGGGWWFGGDNLVFRECSAH